ncbi:MAG TPA: ABC transporter ATP-binding protein [Coriobacteriia bacterium]|jgi:molybdopterin-binding protein
MSAETRAAPILRAEGIRKSYRGRLALEVTELEVEAGTTYALLGSSGAGKSTLLRILGLLERPDAGRVLLDGRELSARDRRSRMRLAMLFQKPYLFRGTVGENVAYGLKARRVNPRERDARVAAVLERVGLPGFAGRDARTLSGGEGQRAALARALVVTPEVLLLDEPLSYMDPLNKERLTREFAEILRGEGVTTVYVTHDQEEAYAVADTVGILHEGRFVASGPLDQVMTAPSSTWTASFLGMEPPVRGRIVGRDDGVAEVEAGEARLYGISDLPVGSQVLVSVRPEDVTLFSDTEEIPHSSARNRVRGLVTDIRPKGAMLRVVVSRDDTSFASLVSRAAVSELGIAEGTPVVAAFKAAATRITSAEGHA